MMTVFLFWGMIASTKTVELSKSLNEKNRQLSKLRKENKELELYILKEHSPSKIRKRAESDYALRLPKKIHFFTSKGNE